MYKCDENKLIEKDIDNLYMIQQNQDYNLKTILQNYTQQNIPQCKQYKEQRDKEIKLLREKGDPQHLIPQYEAEQNQMDSFIDQWATLQDRVKLSLIKKDYTLNYILKQYKENKLYSQLFFLPQQFKNEKSDSVLDRVDMKQIFDNMLFYNWPSLKIFFKQQLFKIEWQEMKDKMDNFTDKSKLNNIINKHQKFLQSYKSFEDSCKSQVFKNQFELNLSVLIDYITQIPWLIHQNNMSEYIKNIIEQYTQYPQLFIDIIFLFMKLYIIQLDSSDYIQLSKQQIESIVKDEFNPKKNPLYTKYIRENENEADQLNKEFDTIIQDFMLLF